MPSGKPHSGFHDSIDRARIRAEKLLVGYGSCPATRDVTLEVRRGEVVALLGPNGTGSTTTLSALAGELRAATLEQWGRLDILIDNAGSPPSPGSTK